MIKAYIGIVYDYDDCEWIIDKATSKEEMLTIKKLYGMEIYQLSEACS